MDGYERFFTQPAARQQTGIRNMMERYGVQMSPEYSARLGETSARAVQNASTRLGGQYAEADLRNRFWQQRLNRMMYEQRTAKIGRKQATLAAGLQGLGMMAGTGIEALRARSAMQKRGLGQGAELLSGLGFPTYGGPR